MAEAIRQSSAEAIGVDVKESEVGEETKLFRQGAGDVGMIQVNSSNCCDMRIVRCRSAVDPLIVADIQAVPVGSKVLGIRKNQMLPCLESCVSI